MKREIVIDEEAIRILDQWMERPDIQTYSDAIKEMQRQIVSWEDANATHGFLS